MRRTDDTSDNTRVYFGDSPYRTWPLLGAGYGCCVLIHETSGDNGRPLPSPCPSLSSKQRYCLAFNNSGRCLGQFTFTSPCRCLLKYRFVRFAANHAAVTVLTSTRHDNELHDTEILISDRIHENTPYRDDWIRVHRTIFGNNTRGASGILLRASISNLRDRERVPQLGE